MEPVGFSIGVVALASLFTTCVECFDYIDAAQSYGRDSELLATKFDIVKSRFLIWGDAIGLLRDGNNSIESPSVRLSQPVIERILNCIHLLFTDTDALMSRYGLKPAPSTPPSAPTELQRLGTSNSMARFRVSFSAFKSRISKSQARISIGKASRWAIHDRGKFEGLIDDLHHFIDGLEKITTSPDMLSRRTQLIYDEVTSMQREHSLNVLLEATAEQYPDWFDAASDVLETTTFPDEDRDIYQWLKAVKIGSDEEAQAAHAGDLQFEDLPAYKSILSEDTVGNEILVTEGNVISTFLTNLTPELKTPLNGILKICAVLMEEDDISKVKRSLRVIYKSGDLLLSLLNDLLMLSGQNVEGRPDVHLELKTFHLRDLEVQCQTIFHIREKDIDLQVTTTNETGAATGNSNKAALKSVYADQHRLLQILINLISNALKFCPHGSIVQVRISCIDSLPGFEHADERGHTKGKLKMEVEDNGPGIPTNLQRSIFEPFNRGVYSRSTLASRSQGMGLGLSICAQLVALMDGVISVKSTVGVGSTFVVTVPIELVDEEENEDGKAESSSGLGD
ncbi:hypothetical protein N431DRAFT_561166 [Stipitochalara longipes BDJ]|nr:hypothetical protein N431DRAFT_561166 [Stipitochalara longipes BDJ]